MVNLTERSGRFESPSAVRDGRDAGATRPSPRRATSELADVLAEEELPRLPDAENAIEDVSEVAARIDHAAALSTKFVKGEIGIATITWRPTSLGRGICGYPARRSDGAPRARMVQTVNR
jgi:hypothetical protein